MVAIMPDGGSDDRGDDDHERLTTPAEAVDADLGRVVAAWPDLTADDKAAILVLLDGAGGVPR